MSSAVLLASGSLGVGYRQPHPTAPALVFGFALLQLSDLVFVQGLERLFASGSAFVQGLMSATAFVLLLLSELVFVRGSERASAPEDREGAAAQRWESSKSIPSPQSTEPRHVTVEQELSYRPARRSLI